MPMFDRARRLDGKQRWAESLLAAVAGYIDAYSLIWLGLYVSFMSGNTTSLGMNFGMAHLGAAVAPAVAILAFVLGSFGSNLALETRVREVRRVVIAVVSASLLAAMAIGMAAGPKLLEIAVLAFGMGLVNPVHSGGGAGPAGVTFVTGTLNRCGKNAALAVRGHVVAKPEGPWDNYWRRALSDFQLWVSFTAGAMLGGLTTSYLKEVALIPAATVLLALAMVTERPSQVGSKAT